MIDGLEISSIFTMTEPENVNFNELLSKLATIYSKRL